MSALSAKRGCCWGAGTCARAPLHRRHMRRARAIAPARVCVSVSRRCLYLLCVFVLHKRALCAPARALLALRFQAGRRRTPFCAAQTVTHAAVRARPPAGVERPAEERRQHDGGQGGGGVPRRGGGTDRERGVQDLEKEHALPLW